MRVGALISVLALASVLCIAQGRLRGSREELEQRLRASPVLLEVARAVEGGSPAEKVLAMLDKMLDDIRAAQEKDSADFDELKGKCGRDAAELSGVLHGHAAAHGAAERAISESGSEIDFAHKQMKEHMLQAEDELREVEKLERDLHREAAAFSEAEQEFEHSDSVYVDVEHAIDAIMAHLEAAGSTVTEESSTALLEVASKLRRAGAHEPADLAEEAARAQEAEDYANAKLRSLEEELEQEGAVVADHASEAAEVDGSFGDEFAAELASEEEESEAGATGATGAVGDITLQIVDTVLSLRNMVHEQREQHRRKFDESRKAYDQLRDGLIERRRLHENVRAAALRARDEAEGRMHAAQLRRSRARSELETHAANVEKAQRDAKAAEDMCVSYAREFQERRENRAKDMEAAAEVQRLIMEKEAELRKKLEELSNLYNSVSGTTESAGSPLDSLDSLAEAYKVPPVQPKLPVQTESEVALVREEFEADAKEIEELHEEELQELAMTGATGFAGTVGGGDV